MLQTKIHSFSIQDHLLRFAAFTTLLNPRMIAASLGLLQSPTKLNITHHDDSIFRDIPNLGHVGGGFIHKGKLFKLLRIADIGAAEASRAVAIQVRIFIPPMGIFKGLLVKKRTMDGAPIELPRSIEKVMRSTHSKRSKGAHIVISKQIVFPSKRQATLRRLFDPSKDNPTDKVLQECLSLSNLILQLWEALGVPTGLCARYKIESIKPARNKSCSAGWSPRSHRFIVSRYHILFQAPQHRMVLMTSL